MKSFLILILSLGLAMAAFFTRPSEADFHDYVQERLPRKGQSLPERILRLPSPTDLYLDGLVFRDRYLWVQVENAEGKVIYAGAFDHWFDRSGLPVTHRQGQRGPQPVKVSRTERATAD